MATPIPGSKDFRKSLASLRKAYGEAVASLRRPLYHYCLSLTGDPVEAEDLNQETLLRCFARLSEVWEENINLKAYHYRAATNLWLNHIKRKAPDLEDDIDQYPHAAPVLHEDRDVRDLAVLVAAILAPHERAAFMLADVFDFSGDEVAAMLETTSGAVKAALHRARTKIAAVRREKVEGSTRRLRASKSLVDAMVAALNARDIEAALKLFGPNAVGEVVGCGYELGLDALRNGSLGVNATYAEFVRVEPFLWRGEWFIALWAKVSGAADAAPNAMLSLVELDGKLAEIKTYYYTPFTLEEVGRESGVPFRPIGRFPFQDQ